MLRSDVIKKFLKMKANDYFISKYEANMQCHVLVAADGGNREGFAWTDGIETWYPFVISSLESNSKPVTYNFEKHVEGIGLTGWDWEAKCSRWVAFDFDSIIGHKSGLQDYELKEIISALQDISWCTILRSTSGRGIHIYVDLEPVIDTENRAEHSAVARAVLHQMSALTGCNFKDKVDICGGNMFIWHRKMTKKNKGLTLIKEGEALKSVPNWKEHIDVITKGKGKQRDFDPIATSKTNIHLDDEHKRLINYLQSTGALWWWDADKHMLVCHTYDLAEAHKDLDYRGIFKTVATGKTHPDHNCFCFPLREGGWVVRRFNKGTVEDSSWEMDDSGWTKCYFNVDANLKIASRTYNGIEHPNGSYIFNTAEEAARAAAALGAHFDLPQIANYCTAAIKEHKDGRLIITIEDKEHKIPQTEMPGWIKDKTKWSRLYTKAKSARVKEDLYKYDNIVRHLVTPANYDFGWALKTDSGWTFESLANIKLALESFDLSSKEVKEILGASVIKNWKIVNIPFATEYPGDRSWNRNSAQMRYQPSIEVPLSLREGCPMWYKFLNHVGESLDEVIKDNAWAKNARIYTGADYLFCWIASIFQEPMEPLPYLFFYGPQNVGKSLFHEVLQTLLIGGYAKADNALTNQQGFNAEIESSVICVVEEVDLSKSRIASNRIKDWVTAREITIHPKSKTPYMTNNITHWIQCANEHSACPIFPGDTRIMVIHVNHLKPKDIIPKPKLIKMLTDEARNFMALLLNYQIPESYDRLNVPVIMTSDKQNIEQSNKTLLEMFISDKCFDCDGQMVKFSEFYSEFIEWLGPTTEFWSKQKVGKELPPCYPRGRLPQTGQFYIGNITFDNEAKSKGKCYLMDDKLLVKEK